MTTTLTKTETTSKVMVVTATIAVMSLIAAVFFSAGAKAPSSAQGVQGNTSAPVFIELEKPSVVTSDTSPLVP